MQWESSEIQDWKKEIKSIESKRHQNLTPQFQGYVKENDKRSNLNVIMQRYNDKQKENDLEFKQKNQIMNQQTKSQNEPFKKKYYNSYDIINYEKIGDFKNNEEFKVKQFVIPPRQINFNIVTNVLTDESLYKNSTAKFEIPKQTGKKFFTHKSRDVDIISLKYRKDHDQKEQQEIQKEKIIANAKIQKFQQFNAITASFYDEQKENLFKSQREINEREHGKDFSKKFPPSFYYREPFILDPAKLPPQLAIVDQKKIETKKRWDLKFQLENEYREKDIQKQEKDQQLSLRKFTNKDQHDRINRGYDIITKQNINKEVENQKLNLSGKIQTWDRIIATQQ